MTGKIRVSIVATALDGHKTENKTVLNMVSRIQNRNSGYSESLFSHNSRMENNTINSIDGATALKLDESYQLDEEQSQSIENLNNDFENTKSIQSVISSENLSNDIPEVYLLKALLTLKTTVLSNKEEDTNLSDNIDEEYTKLFSEDQIAEQRKI